MFAQKQVGDCKYLLCTSLVYFGDITYVFFLPVHVVMLWLMCAGMFAIRAEREYVVGEDFMKAVRKVGDTKQLEAKLDYKQI